jgi:holo-[acyl-carrier protein] synthase
MMLRSARIRCGLDLVHLERFRRSLAHGGDEFLKTCFSCEELDECAESVESLAGRFAAKEAALKALGTGIRGITLHDVVTTKTTVGKPELRLLGNALELSRTQGWISHDVSISHSEVSACAMVVALCREESE